MSVLDIKTINGATSKGNQPKFIKEGYFYKEDMMGYESISEALVSEFLSYVKGVEFIDYYLEVVNRKGIDAYCCKSKIYTYEDESFISVYRLLSQYDKIKGLSKLNGKDAVSYVIDSVYEITGLNIESYLATTFIIDSIILNEDRHLNNICLIQKGSSYRLSPIFDNGLSLLSDLNDYPMYMDISKAIRRVKAKPFNVSFNKQVRYFNFEPLVIDFDSFYNKIKAVIENIDTSIPFKKEEFLRAKTILLKRLNESEGILWVRS